MHPQRSEAVTSLPVEIVGVSDSAACSVIPWVSIDGWRAAVERSVVAAGGTLGAGRPGIRLELMDPSCAEGDIPRRSRRGRWRANIEPRPVYDTRRTEVRYRARLVDEWGHVVDTSEGVSAGVSRTTLTGAEATLSALETTLELAAQDALRPLFEHEALRLGLRTRWGNRQALSLSTTR